jgi:hypothetical protein
MGEIKMTINTVTTEAESKQSSQQPGTIIPQGQKDELIEAEYEIYSDLREIKRLVGSLDAEEDELEQVWRLADSIHNKIDRFQRFFDRLGIYDTTDESGSEEEQEIKFKHWSMSPIFLKSQFRSRNFPYPSL